jgi:hypothetical protein
MSGTQFEDRLADALDRMVGEDGIALLRKQSMSTRRGTFQMSQEADVLLDSALRDYYAAFECKSREHKKSRERGLTGLYFSGDYEDDQIEKQAKYRNLSGRRFFVGVELRDFRGVDAAYLVPIEVFQKDSERGLSKTTWEKMAYLGRYIGDTDSLEVDLDDFQYVEAVGALYMDKTEELEAWVEEVDDGETAPTDTDYEIGK